MAFPKAQKDLEEVLISNLESVKQKQAEILKMWFDERIHDTKVVSRYVSVVMEKNITSSHLKLSNYIEMMKTEYGYKDVRIVSPEGIVLMASEKELVGTNVISHDYCREALNGNVFISKIQSPVNEGNGAKDNNATPIMFMSAPLNDSNNSIVGAVILKIDTAHINAIMGNVKFGKTGEAFLINREGYMLTESRFTNKLKKSGLIQQQTALELKVINTKTGKLTEGVQRCISGNDGYDAEGYMNYNGETVLGSWRWIPEYDCGLLAQINIREGYGAAYNLERFVLSTLIALALPLALVAFYFSKRISDPILKITEATKKITDGDLGQRVKNSSKRDEISKLALAFNLMAESLEEKTIKLKNHTANLKNMVKERTAKLQETTNFLNSILDGSTEYSIIAEDLDGNILDFNYGASRIYGYKPEEVVGIANVKILHLDEDIASGKVDNILEEARKTGRYEGEVQRKRKNGEIFPAHVTFTLRRDEKERPVGFVVISKDITKEKLVAYEKEIINNINKIIASGLGIKEVYSNVYTELRRTIDFVWLGIIYLDDQKNVTEDFSIIDGVPLTNWLNGNKSSFNTIAQNIAVENDTPVFVADILDGKYPFDSELSKKDIHSYLCLPLKSKGKTIGILTLGSRKKEVFAEMHFGILNQIASQLAITIENTRLFASIRESEEKYRDLVENAPEMIHEIDTKGKFINVNKTELNRLGYSLKEMRLMTLEDIVPQKYRQDVKRHIQLVIRTGSSELETVFITKEGKEINVEITGASIYNNKTGECLYERAFVRDITERKKMEEQVRRSEKLASMGELAAAIAHEIRNPLGAICNSIGILDRRLKLGEQDRNLLEMIVEQSDRLDRIISSFLTFAHPREPSFTLQDVREVIKNTIFLLEQDNRFTDKIEIKETYESILPKVYIDADLIHQVLWNLFINSLDAMPNGGFIRLTVRKANLFLRDAVEIMISDSGIGIPPNELDKIFEPFYTTKSEGTGLGLSMVQRIIDDHGGTIDVKSKEKLGTIFYIKLPVGNEKLGNVEGLNAND